jgi:hypothetical protein
MQKPGYPGLNQNYIIMQNQLVDRSVFRKDKLDQNRLKVAKRRFNQSPEAKEKVVTLFKFQMQYHGTN